MSDSVMIIICILYGLFMSKVLISLNDLLVEKEIRTFYSLVVLFSALVLLSFVGVIIL